MLCTTCIDLTNRISGHCVIRIFENLRFLANFSSSIDRNVTSSSSSAFIFIFFRKQILIEVTAPSEVNITNKKSFCGGGSESEGLACDGVKLGDVVSYEIMSRLSGDCL